MRVKRAHMKWVAVVVVLIVTAVIIFDIPEPENLYKREMLTPNAYRPYFTHEFRRLILPSKQLCQSNDPYLVVIVHSAPDNACKRTQIRQTWGSPRILSKVKATLTFVMGSVKDDDVMDFVAEEAAHYGDILQEDFVDTYYNLTHKAVAWLKWITETCPQARYVMKTDDDILADVMRVKQLLQKGVDPGSAGRMTLVCNYWTNTPVVHSYKEAVKKWYVDKGEFAASTYGNICQGSAYIMSLELVRSIYPLTLTTPFFKLDDVYVTGFLVQQFNVSVYPWNDMYATNDGMVNELLSGTFAAPPLFVHGLVKEDFFGIWSHMKRGECCPRRESWIVSLRKAMIG